jgi:MerR family transcriptional regulator, light-induced transcriptional regulator
MTGEVEPMGESVNSGVFGGTSSSWREVIADSLSRVKKRVSGTQHGHRDSGQSIDAVIEAEIIPRLLMAYSGGAADTGHGKHDLIEPSDVTRFASLPMLLDASGLISEVDKLIARGASIESICLDLLAPTARRLGEMWDRDECDFVDVTMGLWRLQEVMHAIAERTPPDSVGYTEAPRSSLFSPMPGDDHNFGTLMIDEVFARAGWQSEALVSPDRSELLDRVAHAPFDLLGLTVSRDCPSGELSNLIKAIRGVSANPHIAVLVGGRMINENPAIVENIGADGTGSDAMSALAVAEQLVLSSPLRADNFR